jgi:hypothetical protein
VGYGLDRSAKGVSARPCACGSLLWLGITSLLAKHWEIRSAAGNTEWYIVEQESYAFPPLECVERCVKNLRAMGK